MVLLNPDGPMASLALKLDYLTRPQIESKLLDFPQNKFLEKAVEVDLKQA